MAHFVDLGDKSYKVNNRLLDRIFSLLVSATDSEALSDDEKELFEAFVARFESGYYWAGRGLRILEDFPSDTERRMFARLLFDAAQAVFEREVGVHANSAWQTQTIHQIHKLAHFFVDSVRLQTAESDDPHERNWWPETRASAELRKLGP